MDKILEKVQEAQAYTNISNGLALAMTVCRRRMLEAQDLGETVLLNNVMQDIYALMTHAKNNIPHLGELE